MICAGVNNRHPRSLGLLAALALLVPAALASASCAPGSIGSIPAGPALVADQTLIDERAMIAAEQSYLAIGAVIEAAVATGLLKGQAAARVDRLDGMAMDAIVAMRTAYDTGNAASFAQALARAKATIEQIRVLTGAPRTINAEARP